MCRKLIQGVLRVCGWGQDGEQGRQTDREVGLCCCCDKASVSPRADVAPDGPSKLSHVWARRPIHCLLQVSCAQAALQSGVAAGRADARESDGEGCGAAAPRLGRWVLLREHV